MANPKAFCSHRSVDKPIVMEVFRKLREAGIDAWVDEWEILPGQDFVTKINQGLKECDVGLVFLSSASMDGKWQQAEISGLMAMMVNENKPLIPVLLDADVPVDPLLQSRSKLGLDQFDRVRRHTGIGIRRTEGARLPLRTGCKYCASPAVTRSAQPATYPIRGPRR